ncbi:MAG: hypothetical protein FWC27_13355 [Firmicutes bacterium]|nr:hypothetical protein [Bacillota bacterium]
MRPFTIGTDWFTDVDDAAAMRVFARAHRAGAIRIEGVCANACIKYTCASLDAFLCNEGLPGIPLGADRAAKYPGRGRYQKRMAGAGAYRTNADCMDAVGLYRAALAGAREPVEMAEIGFCQVLAKLLDSPPDELSPLDGRALLVERCKHIWAMAGKWDVPGGAYNYNFRVTRDNMRAAHRFYENCPVPVTFLGHEAGKSVVTGGVLEGRDDMLARALRDHGSKHGRSSWDPMLALLAITENLEEAGYTAVYGQARIDPKDGKCRWEPGAGGRQRYVVKTRPDSFYRDAINEIIG